jgi:hypothetical protein
MLMSSSNGPATAPDFTEFVRPIHREKANTHSQKFLLPAVYGGRLGSNMRRFHALFVLQDPSLKFTEERWNQKVGKECQTTEMAIEAHRSIFVDWANRDNQAYLFRFFYQLFYPEYSDEHLPSVEEFFGLFYVTDVWKAGMTKDHDADYWPAKLKAELQNVPASRVIFVGGEAWKYQKFVPKGTPSYKIRFPRRAMRAAQFIGHVAQLATEIYNREVLGLERPLKNDTDPNH